MGTKNDKVILNLKKEIKTKKTKIGKLSKFNPVTNCNLTLHGKRYNLHVATKDELTYIIGTLVGVKVGFTSIFPDEEVMFDGFPIDGYIDDATERYKILNISTEKSRLTALEKQLHTLLSVDTKIELSIDSIKDQI